VGDGRQESHSQYAGVAAGGAVDGVGRAFGLREHGARLAEQHFADGCRRHAAAAARKHRRAELGL
jgi:hypothetical protein